MKSALYAALALSLCSVTLVSCKESAPAADETAPDGMPGVSVTNGRLVMPAVRANPGALYFDISYVGEAGRPAMIRGIYVEEAENASLHSSRKMAGRWYMEDLLQLPVNSGETVSLKPGGYHVMVTKISDSVAVGGKVEVTLTFLGGDKYSFYADVLPPGDAG